MSYKSNYESWLKNPNLSEDEIKELKELGKDAAKTEDSFTAPLAFGTAGMRGIIGPGIGRMNVYTVMRATLGLARFINSTGKQACKRGVLIGYDTRRMSFEFAAVAARVLENNGINVFLFENVRPVPFVSFGVRKLKTFAGIMITASHNPKEYNGYKVYGEDGAQLGLEETEKLLGFINAVSDYIGIPASGTEITQKGIAGKDKLRLSKHIRILGKSFDKKFYNVISKLRLSKKEVKKTAGITKIVYTPLHGTGFIPVTYMLESMGLFPSLVLSQTVADPDFSTVVTPNPESPEALTLAVKQGEKIGADAIFGTDPDCDRMGVAVPGADGKFVLLTGNQTGALLLDYVIRRKIEKGKLPKRAASIKTIVTTSLAAKVAESYGVTNIDVLTGFKFFGEKIREWERTKAYTYIFGYEESYGFLPGTHARDKDAVSISMLFAEMVCYYKFQGISLINRLNEIYKKFGYYVEITGNTFYHGVNGMKAMNGIMEKLRKKLPSELGGYKIEYVSDFSAGIKTYSDGAAEDLPQARANVIKFGLAEGDWACVRPSGTEPKLKNYISVHDKTMKAAEAKAKKVDEAIRELLIG